MSNVLKGYIEQEMRNKFPDAALQDLGLFAEVMAKAVQQYLTANVTVIPGTQLVVTAGGPSAQAGTTTTNGKLLAP